jgi:8-amino-7-oxononanoate synthase
MDTNTKTTALEEYQAELTRTLSTLRDEGLLRHLRKPHGIDLVSNDYLGLAEHPRLVERMKAALDDGVAGSAGSRLLRGHRASFDAIESRLAALSGSPAALLFGSGYAANTGLLQALPGPDDVILSDERNHASLIDGMRLSRARRIVYSHRDLHALERALRAPRRGRALIVTESVFSMDGTLSPLADIVELAETHDALVIVDEAHATGLYGARGSGRVEELGLRERVLATVHTGGKALGSAGAWVAGAGVLREVLLNRARTFVFTTAPLPVLAAALDAGLDVLRDEPERRAEVHRKAALLRHALASEGLTMGATAAPGTLAPIVPIIVGENEAALALQEELQAVGFDVRAIRPPTVAPGTARLRVTVRAPIADAELLRFAAEVGRLLRARAA